MIEEWIGRPFSRPLFLWIAGILVQYAWPDAYRWWYVPVGASLFFGVVSRLATGRFLYRFRWCWGAGYACLWFALSVLFTSIHQEKGRWNAPSRNIVALAVVTGPLQEKARSVYVPLVLNAYLDGDSLYTCSKRVNAYFQKDSSLTRVSPGDCLLLYGRFTALPSDSADTSFGKNYLKLRGVAATTYIPSGRWRVSAPSSSTWKSRALRCRDRLAGSFGRLGLSSGEQAVIRALTLGDTSKIDAESRRLFSVAGVAHLLAVSGFHVGIVGGWIVGLLGWMSRWRWLAWSRWAIACAGIWCFVFITGLGAPAVRAACMFSLFLAARLLRRRSDGFNTLAATAFLMLVYRPYYLFDIGFLLSFTAVFFILQLQPKLSASLGLRNPLVKYPWECLTMTLSAQIGTIPLCLYGFGSFSSVFLFTNLPLALLAFLLVPLALLWSLTNNWIPFEPFWGLLVEKSIRIFLRIVELFGRLPGASVTIEWGKAETVFAYLVLILLLIYRGKRNPKIFLTALLALFILLLLLYVRYVGVPGT